NPLEATARTPAARLIATPPECIATGAEAAWPILTPPLCACTKEGENAQKPTTPKTANVRFMVAPTGPKTVRIARVPVTFNRLPLLLLPVMMRLRVKGFQALVCPCARSFGTPLAVPLSWWDVL